MTDNVTGRKAILATLCYVRNEDRTLMLFRNRKKDDIHKQKWNGLGGKFEPGESPEECAIREVYEESGLTVNNPYMRGVLTFPLFDGINDWYVYLFEMHDFNGDLIESPEGELEWIPNEKLLDLNLWEGDKIFLKWLGKPGFYSGVFRYEDGVLMCWNVEEYGDISATE